MAPWVIKRLIAHIETLQQKVAEMPGSKKSKHRSNKTFIWYAKPDKNPAVAFFLKYIT